MSVLGGMRCYYYDVLLTTTSFHQFFPGKPRMNRIELTIDGRKVPAEEGATILEAARSLAIEIPTLCYHPRLTAQGVCRLCVVELQGSGELVPSCSHRMEEGMTVSTDSDRVRSARRMVLELLMSTADISGSEELMGYARRYGAGSGRFHPDAPKVAPIMDDNPFYVRDYTKCVMCRRCVQACGEDIQHTHALTIAERGLDSSISTFSGRSMPETSCVFCGACIHLCPTGAIYEKRPLELGLTDPVSAREVLTVCPYCGVGCSIVLHIRNGEILKATSPEESAVNRGNLCVKGKFGFDFVTNKDRLREPLIKRNGGFEAAAWDEALSLAASRLKEIKEKHGPESVGGIASGKCTNEDNYLFQKFMRAVMGTNSVDHCARLCHASSVTALQTAIGSAAMSNSIGEIRDLDCFLLAGSNTTETHPVISLEMKAAVKKGAKLIVADPRKIEMTEFASLWLRQRPGTDVPLFNAMANVIISRGLEDRAFIENRTDGYETFRKAAAGYTPERAEAITGVPAESIIEAAVTFGEAERAAIYWAMGITEHTRGTANASALANLALLTGNLGKECTGLNPLRGQNNVQGASDWGALYDVYPGYQPVADESARRKFEKAWGVPLPERAGSALTDMIEKAGRGEVKALYIMGENTMMSEPNLNRTREALMNVEFLVVQDIFLTETARLADVVFPAASFAEKDGTFTNTERRVQRVRKALEPVGESKPDWLIICELAQRMGYDMRYDHPSEIFDEMVRLVPSHGGISYRRIEEKGLQWPCPTANHPGTRFLFAEGFPGGSGKFQAVEYVESAELPDDEFPLMLTTGRVLYHWHGGSVSRHSRGLKEIYPEGVVEINEEDAGRIPCGTGETVRVISRRGEIVLKVKVTDKSPPGVVFIPFHFAEAAANVLTIDALDPQARIPEYKVCAVRVEKIDV